MRALRIIACLLLSLPVFASRPIQPPAPEFPPRSNWINARGLSMARLRGRRVVLVAFLDTMNVNSMRTVAALRQWDERYSLEGLMVIGVHTPEYDFQKDPAALKGAFRAWGVKFPVVLDNDRAIWKAYANDGWPAFYLISGKGRIVFDKLGEGGYQELESMIQAEIERLTGSPPSGGAPSVEDPTAVGGECGEMTPELSLGSRSDKEIVNLDGVEPADTAVLATTRDGEFSTRGRWISDPEALRLNQQNADLSAFARVIYRGAQGFGLFGPGAGPSKFWLRQDDLWLDSANAGKDVRFDAEQRSFVLVDGPRLYDIVRNPNDNVHELVLIPLRSGSRIYALSFSNRCLKVK